LLQRQRMASEIHTRQVREVTIQIGIDRAGNMARQIGLASALRRIELLAAIENQRIVALDQRRQFPYRYQGALGHVAASSRRSRFCRMAAVAPQMRLPSNWNSKISRPRPCQRISERCMRSGSRM